MAVALPAPTLVSPANDEIITVTSLPTQVPCQWQAVSGASGYELDIDGNQITITSGSQTTYTATISGVGAHSWRARTKNSAGVGSWSSTNTFTISTNSESNWNYPVTPYEPGSYEGRSFFFDQDHLGEVEELPEGTPIQES